MKRLLVLVTLSFAPCLCAQENDAPSVGVLVVQSPTPLLVRPAANAHSFGIERLGVKLLWVEGQVDSGYLRAVGQYGPVGWVAANNVQILRPPTNAYLAESLNRPPCKTPLSACPPIGCATVNSPEALANEAKQRAPSGVAPIPLNFSDLAKLEIQAQAVVGQRKVPQSRSVLSNFRVAAGTVSEGSAVLVGGFIAVNNPGPHPNSGESVNCNLTSPGDNDFHINITPAPHQAEFGGIVVEMIPQHRPSGWSIEKLQVLRQRQTRVLVGGGLFYDSIHVVNDDPRHPIGGQPKRFSLWEIHPVAGFFVCNRLDNQCDPRAQSDWTRLADFDPN